MQIGEVLKRVPGVTKRFLYYLEAKHYIAPRLVPKDRLSRRDYSEEQVDRIKRAFELYNRGFAPRVAVRLAASPPLLVTSLDSGLLSLRLSPDRETAELVFAHTGPTGTRIIQIVPETQFLVNAAPTEDPNRFVLHASLLLSGHQGPFLVRLLREGKVVRQIQTDVEGNGRIDQLTIEDLEALKRCDQVEIARASEPPSDAGSKTNALQDPGSSALGME